MKLETHGGSCYNAANAKYRKLLVRGRGREDGFYMVRLSANHRSVDRSGFIAIVDKCTEIYSVKV